MKSKQQIKEAELKDKIFKKEQELRELTQQIESLKNETKLGKKLYSWSFSNNFWVKVFENGVKLRKRKQAEIIIDDYEMDSLNKVLNRFFKDRKEKKENKDMLNELEKEKWR